VALLGVSSLIEFILVSILAIVTGFASMHYKHIIDAKNALYPVTYSYENTVRPQGIIDGCISKHIESVKVSHRSGEEINRQVLKEYELVDCVGTTTRTERVCKSVLMGKGMSTVCDNQVTVNKP
jgi:hypothetical protein